MNKLTYPKSSAQVAFKVEGVYGTPEEWKSIDDTNPGLFTYTTRCFVF
jgi:hypothetical protein